MSEIMSDDDYDALISASSMTIFFSGGSRNFEGGGCGRKCIIIYRKAHNELHAPNTGKAAY